MKILEWGDFKLYFPGESDSLGMGEYVCSECERKIDENKEYMLDFADNLLCSECGLDALMEQRECVPGLEQMIDTLRKATGVEEHEKHKEKYRDMCQDEMDRLVFYYKSLESEYRDSMEFLDAVVETLKNFKNVHQMYETLLITPNEEIDSKDTEPNKQGTRCAVCGNVLINAEMNEGWWECKECGHVEPMCTICSTLSAGVNFKCSNCSNEQEPNKQEDTGYTPERVETKAVVDLLGFKKQGETQRDAEARLALTAEQRINKIADIRAHITAQADVDALRGQSFIALQELCKILRELGEGYTDGSGEYEVPLEHLASWLNTHSFLGHITVLKG